MRGTAVRRNGTIVAQPPAAAARVCCAVLCGRQFLEKPDLLGSNKCPLAKVRAKPSAANEPNVIGRSS
jgi:hypothetical protein